MSFLFFSSTLLMTVLALFILNPLLVSYYHFYKCPKIIAVENFSRSKIIAKLTLCFAMSTVCTTTQLFFASAFLRFRVLPQTTVSLALPPACAAVEALLLFFHCLFSLRLLLPFRLLLVCQLKLLLVRFLAWQLKWLCRLELLLQLSLLSLLDVHGILLAAGNVLFQTLYTTERANVSWVRSMIVPYSFNYKKCDLLRKSAIC